MKQWLKYSLVLIVGVLLFLLWLRFIDIHQVLEILKTVKVSWVVLSIACYIFAYFLRSLRWRILLSPIVELPIGRTFNLFMAGMLINYIVPIRAGELAKSMFLKRSHGIAVSKSLPTVFLDKLFDMSPVILILTLLPIIPIAKNPTINGLVWSVSVIFGILLVMLFLIVKYKETAKRTLALLFCWLPTKYRSKINNFVEMFVESLSSVQTSKKNILLIVLLTVSAVLMDTLYVVLIFKAFGYNMSWLIALFGYALINLSYILPTPPAQVGSNEAIYIVIFTLAFGIGKNLVSATLGFAHLLTAIIIFALGAIGLSVLGLNMGKALKVSIYNEE